MIDWLTCRIPCRLPGPIDGGATVKVDRAGNVERVTPHRLVVQGSFEASILVRAVSREELELSGNVAKWLQGHNLYGPDCPRQLLRAALQRLEPVLGIPAAEAVPDDLLELATLSRVDCTEMAQLPDIGAVRAWLRDAHALASAGHRGRGVMTNGTLVFGHAKGKSFTFWQLVCYAKGDETDVHRLPKIMHDDQDVRAWVACQLRLEARFGRLYLDRAGLRRISGWNGGEARALWETVMQKLEFSDAAPADQALRTLPRELQASFALWQMGRDLRSFHSKATFYRHRSALRAAIGVDIAVPPPPADRPTAQIVPIRRRLEAVVTGRPEWAGRIDRQLVDQGCIAFSSAA